jgi:hypothetical protein
MSTLAAGGHVAANCFDGNFAPGAGLCHTTMEANPWLQLDLGTSFTVSMVRIYNRVGELAPSVVAPSMYYYM